MCTTRLDVHGTTRCARHDSMCTTRLDVHDTTRCARHDSMCTTRLDVHDTTRCARHDSMCTTRLSQSIGRTAPAMKDYPPRRSRAGLPAYRRTSDMQDYRSSRKAEMSNFSTWRPGCSNFVGQMSVLSAARRCRRAQWVGGTHPHARSPAQAVVSWPLKAAFQPGQLHVLPRHSTVASRAQASRGSISGASTTAKRVCAKTTPA